MILDEIYVSIVKYQDWKFFIDICYYRLIKNDKPFFTLMIYQIRKKLLLMIGEYTRAEYKIPQKIFS